MTINAAKQIVQSMGCTLRKTDGEFRVNFKGAAEDTAYYTNDLFDAVETARLMGGEWIRRKAELEGIDA